LFAHKLPLLHLQVSDLICPAGDDNTQQQLKQKERKQPSQSQNRVKNFRPRPALFAGRHNLDVTRKLLNLPARRFTREG
jgi:hypothetical protein